MISTANTALLSKQALLGASILGCCCKIDEPDLGGRQFPVDGETNPFVTFTPIPTESQETQSVAPEGHAEPVSMRRISNRAILPPGTAGKHPRFARLVSTAEEFAMRGPSLDGAVREAFQQYLIWEEDEFLALILAADGNECCYECPN